MMIIIAFKLNTGNLVIAIEFLINDIGDDTS
jgi:hypothetical protein